MTGYLTSQQKSKLREDLKIYLLDVLKKEEKFKTFADCRADAKHREIAES